MPRSKTPWAARRARHLRLRRHVVGSAERPRLNVFRSSRHIYAQIIDDAVGHTVVSANTREAEAGGGTKSEKAKIIGRLVASRAKAQGVTTVVFDRGGYQFHGRVKELAEAAREEGLAF